MKKTITFLSLAFCILNAGAQTTTADFETFTLSPSSAYSPTNSIPFQTTNAKFQYLYNSSWSLWTGGFSYTNIHDSITGDYSHPYGVRAYKGFNSSEIFVVGQDRGSISLTAPQSTVNGFYITNTTYAYKSMAKGDLFARKFGDTTGTGSGTTIAQGSYPDFFRVVVKGYKNGLVKNDSVNVYLANFTFTNNTQDYILDTWQYVNTSSIGEVDSIKFFMRSSDVGSFGINTPLYFAIDNFETSAPSTVGINENLSFTDLKVYPNPFESTLIFQTKTFPASIVVSDLSGKIVYSETLKEESSLVDLSSLQGGVYFMVISQGDQRSIKKLIKN